MKKQMRGYVAELTTLSVNEAAGPVSIEVVEEKLSPKIAGAAARGPRRPEAARRDASRSRRAPTARLPYIEAEVSRLRSALASGARGRSRDMAARRHGVALARR